MKYPLEVQGELFNRLIDTAKYTQWGKAHDYKSIGRLSTFKDRVPIQDYEDLKPYVERIQKGEDNVLWPSEIKWFAKSSGTTSDRSKFIPVSKEALEECHYKGGKDLLAIHINNNPDSKIYKGKTLVVGGSSEVNHFREDSYTGDLSAIIINNLPMWVEIKTVPNRQIALMDQWEEKIEKMAESTKDKNVSVISGVPSWTLVLLNRILEMKGADNIGEVWPNLELFMHGGVSFTPYRDQYKSMIPNPGMNYIESYNASEGFFGIQDEMGRDDMLLMLDYGIYYEFMPVENLDDENPRTYSLDEVETGRNYAIIISTNAGLWRYNIGDTIRFTTLNPYRIQVTGRTKHFINACGEELIIDNAEWGLKEACEKTGAAIKEYTAGPIYMKRGVSGGHEWLIEFEKSPDSIERFSNILDEKLRELNSDYDAKRTKDLALAPPLVRDMQSGTFFEWMKTRNRLGGQNKVPRLSNDRKFLDSILETAYVE